MKKLDQQLQRLLHAAAAAPLPETGESAALIDAADLLRQRERELARTEIAIRQVFRIGLATACLLLIAALGFGRWHIERANADVFAVSELALTHISTP